MFETGNTYRFDTMAPSILGATYTDMLCDSDISYLTLSKSVSIATLHQQVQPYLPTSKRKPPEKSRYIAFIHVPSGVVHYFAKEWIVENSVSLVQDKALTLIIKNPTDETRGLLVSVLSQLGLEFEIVE